MSRVRTDNVFGTVTDNPLTSGATTLNSAGLANLAAITAPQEAIIILDPNRVSGAPEIIVVTAHTASATSATVQRGQFGTTARSHVMGTSWVHGPFAGNASTFVTAADDQGDYVSMDAWESYTPTLVQSAAVTKTVTYARFIRIGRTIHCQMKLAVTGTGTASNNVIVGLPVTAGSHYEAINSPIGCGELFDTSAGLRIKFIAFVNTTSDMLFRATHTTSNGNLGTTDFTAALASGDLIQLTVVYEAAS